MSTCSTARAWRGISKVIVVMLISTAASMVHAETWTQAVGIQLVEPLAAWQGGMVRVRIDTPIVTAQCGTSTIFDFLFQGGTSESRSAVISALYMAFAMDRQIKLYFSDGACGPVGAPLFTAIDVLR